MTKAGDPKKTLEEIVGHLGHILDTMKYPNGEYYCVICRSEAKETARIETKEALVLHLLQSHFDFYMGLRFGVEFTLRPLRSFVQFIETLSKQREIIRLKYIV